ncbi:hypothetical protein RJ640_019228 [Escallonia rubra]|uniref:Uncharacterized protein n=1 Tax=Escallonia rubra TaxID=112253 RepID=A0AA88UDM2_9ASTE|nr:hypothetical protein RJ640_019228 [Escallonia rubra]
MQLQVISKETIKPSSPTQSHLQSYNLSLLDQFTPRMYIPFVLFYRSYVPIGEFSEKSRWLKNSLSTTLAQYYPFAGRLKASASVDCNDNGVEFLEARISCRLSELLENPDHEALDTVFPANSVWGKMCKESSLMVIQLNYFQCGGIAIAVGISHRVADACTLSNFLTYWAAVASGSAKKVPPHFIPSPKNDSVLIPEMEFQRRNWVTRRFVFLNSEIAQIKAASAENPTRVEAVTAILYKCAVASARACLGSFRPSLLIQPVNMRPNMEPPLPETSVGNIYSHVTVQTKNEGETDLNRLIGEIKRAKARLKGVKNLEVNEWISVIQECLSNNYDGYLISSFCRYPFYQVDFGWGKPCRVSLADAPTKNDFFLMDTATGDGIEALVTLEEQQMIMFENDKDIQTHASLHPGAL